MELKDALLLLMSGGGGVIVYWLMENVEALKKLRSDHKRYVSWLMSAAIPVLAWGGFLLLGYEPLPTSWQAVMERLFALIMVAFSINQGTHAAIHLSKKQ